MSETFKIKRGSCEPQLTLKLTNYLCAAKDLSGASEFFLCVAKEFDTPTAQLAIKKSMIEVDLLTGELLADWDDANPSADPPTKADTDVPADTYRTEVNYKNSAGKSVRVGLDDFYIEIVGQVELKT
jgi:hypothetical protein